MARFYGKMRGRGKELTRTGTTNSGLSATLASYDGAVRVTLYVDGDGKDCAFVRLTKWLGKGPDKVLYDGPIGGNDES